MLTLVLCAAAGAEAYTHPAAGYHLTIPEGWMVVDSANVDEVISSGRMSDIMAATITSLRGMIDSEPCVYLFQADAVEPPFINVSINLKGELEEDITLDDLLATAQAYQAYYLEETEQFPGYTIANEAEAGQAEGGYPMGILGGVFMKGDYQIMLIQIFIGAGAQFYECTLTAELKNFEDAASGFMEMVESFRGP
jgi:hypothetical protein